MKRAAVIAFGLLSSLSYAAPVFKVENGENVMYLAGTMHLLNKSDYPLPSAFKQAYEASDTLVFETDVAAMNTPEVQQQSVAMLTYTDGGSLSDSLSKQTLSMLQAHLQSRQVPYESFKLLKPGLAGVMLSVIELSKLGLTHPGVDMYYNTLAIGDGKAISWFEEPREQFAFLAKMGEQNSDEYIQYSLNDIENLPASITTLKSVWRSGDLQQLETVGITAWAQRYPEIYALILSERNNKWMKKLHVMLKDAKTEMVLVGALHLAGKDGLIEQLKKSGYAVSQID
jgi:uncharacterized protein YbaP (TraB family)